MTLLVLGLVIWFGVHLVPSVGAGMRAGIVARIGEIPFKGLFAVTLVGAIVLMVKGWKSIDPAVVYAAPAWGRSAALVLVFLTFVLFVAANTKTNIKRILRHPQLTGLILWSIAHLLANGDNRSIVLFGVLGIWGITEIIVINRRDGAWQKPDAVPATVDVITVVIGAAVFGALAYFHQYLSGVALFA